MKQPPVSDGLCSGTKGMNDFSNKHRYLLPLCLSIFLTACASPQINSQRTTSSEAERLESDVSMLRIQLEPALAISDLDRALRLYALIDDQTGQARTHLKLVNVYSILGKTGMAKMHLAHAEQLIPYLNDTELVFDIRFLSARLSNDASVFSSLLPFAKSVMQQALVLTYLAEYSKAWHLIENMSELAQQKPVDYAFVALQYARNDLDVTAAEQALTYYKKADHHRGIAAALQVLSEVFEKAGDTDIATQYRKRADVTLRALQGSAIDVNTP
jgi:tetratricopeptide (TPR) repeat protein